MLLMVENPLYGNNDTVLRTLDELQPGGTVRHVPPHRQWCAFTLFQGPSLFKPAVSERLKGFLEGQFLGLYSFDYRYECLKCGKRQAVIS